MTPKTKPYYFGDLKFEAYCRPAGLGWECGLKFKGEPVFVGNFVHKPEATMWWKEMNKYMTQFCNKYDYMENAPTTWYPKFVSHYMYKHYYTFLDKVFTAHNRTYAKHFTTDVKKYKNYARKSA